MLSQSSEVTQLKKTHNLQDINSPVTEEEEAESNTEETFEPSVPEPAIESKIRGKNNHQVAEMMWQKQVENSEQRRGQTSGPTEGNGAHRHQDVVGHIQQGGGGEKCLS